MRLHDCRKMLQRTGNVALIVSYWCCCFWLCVLQGVDYARRAANRRAMWGDYEDEEEQQEEWSG
jgi:hypothetical protein